MSDLPDAGSGENFLSGDESAPLCAPTTQVSRWRVADLNSEAWAGVAIALCANSVIPIALNAQKLAHKRNTGTDGKPLHPMTKIPLWWFGITLMIAGESLNFLAYGYAPASIVAPIGATSVFVNGIITATLMNEPFTCRNAIGLILIASGVVMLVTAIPPPNDDLTAEKIATSILPSPRAWGYLLAVSIFVLLWRQLVVPRYKEKHVLAYLVLCSVISSVTVVSCRAFMSISTDVLQTGGFDQLASPVPFCALALVIVTAIWSTFYLNKAMMHFKNSEVVPVYFTTFTLASIGAGALVYREFQCLTPRTAIVFSTGCIGTFIGVKLVATNHSAASSDGTRGTPGKLSRFRRLVDGIPPAPGASPTEQQLMSMNGGQPSPLDASVGAEQLSIRTCSAEVASASLRAAEPPRAIEVISSEEGSKPALHVDEHRASVIVVPQSDAPPDEHASS
mmetsp:Transcript_4037/g.13727  ORF Transcript_4037/g.13727 Transcript_4037/m.13727 type:complete len:450 (+) Transcript_4037:113-1462(+)